MMRVGIAADHGGWELKNDLVRELESEGYEITGYGAHSFEDGDDYPDYVIQLARAVTLGGAIGELAGNGRDKLTFLTSDPLASFGLWLEQLIAESTGKDGTGILHVAGEKIGIRTTTAKTASLCTLSYRTQNTTTKRSWP